MDQISILLTDGSRIATHIDQDKDQHVHVDKDTGVLAITKPGIEKMWINKNEWRCVYISEGIDEHSEEKEGTIETYCNCKCDFNEGGICRYNWLRIYEGNCDSYQWTNELSMFK